MVACEDRRLSRRRSSDVLSVWSRRTERVRRSNLSSNQILPIPPGICLFALIRKAVNTSRWGQQIYTKTKPHFWIGQFTIAPKQEKKQVGRCIISQICCSLFIWSTWFIWIGQWVVCNWSAGNYWSISIQVVCSKLVVHIAGDGSSAVNHSTKALIIHIAFHRETNDNVPVLCLY